MMLTTMMNLEAADGGGDAHEKHDDTDDCGDGHIGDEDGDNNGGGHCGKRDDDGVGDQGGQCRLPSSKSEDRRANWRTTGEDYRKGQRLRWRGGHCNFVPLLS